MKAQAMALAAFFVTSVLPAQTIYNSVAGWDSANNPSANGPWSLGYKTSVAGSLTLFTSFTTSTLGGATFEFWHDLSGMELGVGLNTSSSLDWSDGPTVVNPQEINLHPGPSGEMAVIRFTAPTTGDYSFTGVISGNSTAGTTTTVYFVHNATTFYTQSVSGYNSSYGFGLLGSLTSGDTVDIVVDWGSNANYFNDSTGIYATFTAVPEPSAWAAVAGVVALGGAFMRRRRNGGR